MIAAIRRSTGADPAANVLIRLWLTDLPKITSGLTLLGPRRTVKRRRQFPDLRLRPRFEMYRAIDHFLGHFKVLAKQETRRDQFLAVGRKAMVALIAGKFAGQVVANFQSQQITNGVAVLGAIEPPEYGRPVFAVLRMKRDESAFEITNGRLAQL